MSIEDVKTSKAMLIYRRLREEFESGRIASGDRLPSEHELCERFGASRPSVRQATARLAHEGLTRTERGVGTFRLAPPANRSRDAAIVLPRLTSYIYPEIVEAAAKAFSDRSYQTLFDCSEGEAGTEQAILERLLARRPAGVVVSPLQKTPIAEPDTAAISASRSLLRDLRAAGVEVVLLDNTLGDPTFPSIVLDDYGAGRRAAAYLMGKGSRVFALAWSANHAPFHERRRGFIAALSEAGIELTPELDFTPDPSVSREERATAFAAGLAAAITRASSGRVPSAEAPPAVFCVNDELALDVRGAALKLDLRCPEDYLLVGFDDSPLARVTDVSLTSFAYPSRYMGERAAAILMERVEGDAGFARTSIIIDPILVERGSSRGGAAGSDT